MVKGPHCAVSKSYKGSSKLLSKNININTIIKRITNLEMNPEQYQLDIKEYVRRNKRGVEALQYCPICDVKTSWGFSYLRLNYCQKHDPMRLRVVRKKIVFPNRKNKYTKEWVRRYREHIKEMKTKVESNIASNDDDSLVYSPHSKVNSSRSYKITKPHEVYVSDYYVGKPKKEIVYISDSDDSDDEYDIFKSLSSIPSSPKGLSSMPSINDNLSTFCDDHNIKISTGSNGDVKNTSEKKETLTLYKRYEIEPEFRFKSGYHHDPYST